MRVRQRLFCRKRLVFLLNINKSLRLMPKLREANRCDHDVTAETASIRPQNAPKTPAQDRKFDGPVRTSRRTSTRPLPRACGRGLVADQNGPSGNVADRCTSSWVTRKSHDLQSYLLHLKGVRGKGYDYIVKFSRQPIFWYAVPLQRFVVIVYFDPWQRRTSCDSLNTHTNG